MTIKLLLITLLLAVFLSASALAQTACRLNRDCRSKAAPICCGGKCIAQSSRCINNIACPASFDAVCGRTCYDTNLRTCFQKKYLCKRGSRLCGTRCYDPTKFFCANNRRLCATDQSYCPEADQCYTTNDQNCCPHEKKLCPVAQSDSCCSSSTVPQGSCTAAAPLACGSNRCYSNTAAACFGGTAVCQHGWGYCGTQCYDYSKFFCPDSINLCSTSELFCPEANQCYDPLAHICCAAKAQLCLRSDKTCCPGFNY